MHSVDLARWALESAQSENFRIKASTSWVKNFKKKYRIVSRKAVKIISRREVENQANIEESIRNFKQQFDQVVDGYSPR